MYPAQYIVSYIIYHVCLYIYFKATFSTAVALKGLNKKMNWKQKNRKNTKTWKWFKTRTTL